MAGRKKLRTTGPTVNTPPETNMGLSPVAQMLQSFATGGPSVTKGLMPVGNDDLIGSDNANLNSGMLSTAQNRFNIVNQQAQEALRRTENLSAEIRSKQEAIKQQAIQRKLMEQQQAFQMKQQAALLAAQKANRPAVPNVSVPNTTSNGKKLTIPKTPALNIPTDPGDPGKLKFPKAKPPNGRNPQVALPKCEKGPAGVIKRGLGLCQ